MGVSVGRRRGVEMHGRASLPVPQALFCRLLQLTVN